MQKRLQNRVAESRLTLPGVMVYAIAIWLMSGLLIPSIPFQTTDLIHQGKWPQFISFLVTTYLMVELNNGNALIRIYSRSVSSSFAVLTCAASFLLPSFPAAIVSLCVAAFYVLLFHCYQDKLSMGWTFYAFLCIGLSSIVFVQILYYVPLFWILMYFRLSSLSVRTFAASLTGLVTPYWFLLPMIIYKNQFSRISNHFGSLIDIHSGYSGIQLTTNHLLIFLFVVILAVTGIVHFWRNSWSDRIRIRQLYGFFTIMTIFTIILLILQPQFYDCLLTILIISTAPLTGHFFALTHTRITNIAFILFGVISLILTIVNLWIPLPVF